MLHIVTWKWGTLFGPEYVNRLHSGLRRHLHMPFIFRCITDDPTGLDKSILTLPMYTDHMEMKAGRLACFRRLRIFDRDMCNVLGPRILQLDLDAVIVDDVTPLFDRPEPLVMVKQSSTNDGKRTTHNPSMLLMDAGVLHDMWAAFHKNPQGAHSAAKLQGWACSDMSIINDWIFRKHISVATWDETDGVMPYWRSVRKKEFGLKEGSRIVLFFGKDNPGDAQTLERSPWISEHWQ